MSIITNPSYGTLAATLGGVFRSTDGGIHWNPLANGINYEKVITLLSTSSGDLYAGTWYNGIFRYRPTTTAWETLNNGLNESIITSLCMNKSGYLFAGSYSGNVYRSIDSGRSWGKISDGLSGSPVLTLFVDSSGYVFVGTAGSGMYRSIESTLSSVYNTNVANYFRLEQNYPNPFNPKTAISFQLSVISFVTLRVFDILGREVTTLTNGVKEAGLHRIEWNASGFRGGIYFYRIKIGNSTETKKMILLR
jgi:photosystem II stability/assembly factor-like uncharacterized protein